MQNKEPDWAIFEKNATFYLNKNIRIKGVWFQGKGGSNSTDTDIFVYKDKKKLFTIEAKKSPCQSGQIVVLLKNGKYEYSEDSKSYKNSFVDKIILHLNNNFHIYSNPTKTAIPIQISKKVLAEWIKKHYEEHDVKFIITSTEIADFDSSFIKILPLKELENNFEINAVLRRKKSGTAVMPAKYYLEVSQLLKDKIGNNFYLSTDGNLKYNGMNLDKEHLDDNFYIREEGAGYQIRKKSKTNNPNVMFELRYKGLRKTEGIKELRDFILKQI